MPNHVEGASGKNHWLCSLMTGHIRRMMCMCAYSCLCVFSVMSRVQKSKSDISVLTCWVLRRAEFVHVGCLIIRMVC